MYHLAKVGFTQSYTYFAWRNTKTELTDYFTELTQKRGTRVFSPQPLDQYAGYSDRTAPTWRSPRLHGATGLAATLGASYGIYGPAFELYEDRPQKPGSEEYLDSEKYEIRHWDIDEARQPQRVYRG